MRLLALLSLFISINTSAQKLKKPFAAIAFFTDQNAAAHISFVKEANVWFAEMAKSTDLYMIQPQIGTISMQMF